MLRNILSVIVGFIVMNIAVAGSFTAVYLAMGEEWAYKPGVYEVTMGWIIMSIVVGVIAALLGGIVCAKVSKHSKGAILSLMGLVGVLGALIFVGILVAPKPEGEALVRTPPTSVTDAPNKAIQPAWTAALNPIIGIIGVMLGATLVCPKHGPKSSGDAQAEASNPDSE